MVNKKSVDRTIAGVLPERSRLYNVAFPAAGVSAQSGPTWPFASIERGVKKRCKDVRPLGGDDRNNRRALGATDKISDLRFVALMTHANGRCDDIESMLYACVFTDLNMTDEWADAIDSHLDVTLAYADDGDLYLVASPNIIGAFEDDFFDSQLLYYLDDIRNALRLVLDDGTHRNAAAAALRKFMAGSDPDLGAFKNPLAANRFRIKGEATMFGPRLQCPSCKGKGRKFFRPCPDCNGIGFTR
ncbi:MAG: hypothetical protein R3C60_05365 [Parvularculaceae bacterium]